MFVILEGLIGVPRNREHWPKNSREQGTAYQNTAGNSREQGTQLRYRRDQGTIIQIHTQSKISYSNENKLTILLALHPFMSIIFLPLKYKVKVPSLHFLIIRLFPLSYHHGLRLIHYQSLTGVKSSSCFKVSSSFCVAMSM